MAKHFLCTRHASAVRTGGKREEDEGTLKEQPMRGRLQMVADCSYLK